MPTLRLITIIVALLAFSAAARVSASPGVMQPAPLVSIFYYPWYGTPSLDSGWTHWITPGGSTLDIASNYFPARGLYSSSDPHVVAGQMREIARAGVREVITSWWGWGSPEDVRLPIVLKAARAAGLSVAVHLEPYSGRTIESVKADIEHLRTLGITRFFVYHPFDIEPEAWAAVRDSLQGVHLFAQTPLVGRAASARFDGVYTYDILMWGSSAFSRLCSQAHRVGLTCLPSVGPGYDASRATGDPRVKDRGDGATYDRMWNAAIVSSADGVTITSYNEWHEGTQIEAARTRPGQAATASFATYDGAYGLHGRPAEHAYLDRTVVWSAAFVRSRVVPELVVR